MADLEDQLQVALHENEELAHRLHALEQEHAELRDHADSLQQQLQVYEDQLHEAEQQAKASRPVAEGRASSENIVNRTKWLMRDAARSATQNRLATSAEQEQAKSQELSARLKEAEDRATRADEERRAMKRKLEVAEQSLSAAKEQAQSLQRSLAELQDAHKLEREKSRQLQEQLDDAHLLMNHAAPLHVHIGDEEEGARRGDGGGLGGLFAQLQAADDDALAELDGVRADDEPEVSGGARERMLQLECEKVRADLQASERSRRNLREEVQGHLTSIHNLEGQVQDLQERLAAAQRAESQHAPQAQGALVQIHALEMKVQGLQEQLAAAQAQAAARPAEPQSTEANITESAHLAEMRAAHAKWDAQAAAAAEGWRKEREDLLAQLAAAQANHTAADSGKVRPATVRMEAAPRMEHSAAPGTAPAAAAARRVVAAPPSRDSGEAEGLAARVAELEEELREAKLSAEEWRTLAQTDEKDNSVWRWTLCQSRPQKPAQTRAGTAPTLAGSFLPMPKAKVQACSACGRPLE